MKKILSLGLALGLFLTGCSKGTDKKSDKESDKKEYVEQSEILNVYTDPDKYKGKYIKLTGQLFLTPEKDADGIYFQMWGDPENYDLNTVVSIADTSMQLSNNDYVIVDGKIEGAFKGENSYGGVVNALQITAISVEKGSYQEIMAPTIKEVVPTDAINSQHGVDISITKIEFSEKETRVYYTVSNNSGTGYSFYDFRIKIVQNGKQYEEQSNYDADYPSVSGTIINGVTSEGILPFPALEQSNFDIHIEAGYSDDYKKDFEAITFNIAVE